MEHSVLSEAPKDKGKNYVLGHYGDNRILKYSKVLIGKVSSFTRFDSNVKI
jgi:hypothetical protein